MLALACLWIRSWRFEYKSGTEKFAPFILGLWHHQFPLCLPAFQNQALATLISQSRDGDWLCELSEAFGYLCIRGSSSRGSLTALRTSLKLLVSGKSGIAIALDGPKGPRLIPKPGILWLSQKSGLPIRLVHFSFKGGWALKSWDRCVLPWPGSRIKVHLGYEIHAENWQDFLDATQGQLQEKNSGQPVI